MESDWSEVARISLPHYALLGASTAASALCFDTNQELLWVGSEYGRLMSFCGGDLRRYTSYRANPISEGPVKQILSCEKGIVSLAMKSIHFAERRGRSTWHAHQSDFIDLRCMSFIDHGSTELIAAGCQTSMFRINIDRGEIVETLESSEQYTQMQRGGQYICAATANGRVQLLDPKYLNILKSWNTHAGWINDMDANSNFLVTCGWSPRQQYGNMLDPLAKVFDLKTLSPLPPVPFHAGAAFVRMHPRMQTTGVIASQSGQLQLVDIMNTSMVNVRQVNLVESFLVHLVLAPSGEAFALADSVGCIHLWGSPSRMSFNEFAQPVDFADSSPRPSMNDWSEADPLNYIGIPFYRDTLLSAWPSHLTFETGAPPMKIDSSIMAKTVRTEFGAFAVNPQEKRRNEIEDTRLTLRARNFIDAPKFLSEQAKDRNGDEHARRMSESFKFQEASTLGKNHQIEIPPMYKSVEIKYSRFGVDDFDFEYYNKTKYSGLETHIENSYLNALLQVLRFVPLVRNIALHHTASPCHSEICLLCELGFLFDMLEKANGQNCQATNFLKVFRTISNASSLGLLEETNPNRPMTLMIQATNRFILEKMTSDFRQMAPQSAQMNQLLMTNILNNIKCGHCGNETVRPQGLYVHDLIYPPRPVQKSTSRVHITTFSQVLKASVERQDQTRGWCDRCKRYQQLSGRRTIQNIPPVLTINTAIHSSEAKKLWTQPNWLPQEIGIINEQGQFFCYEGQDLQMHLQRNVFAITVFELIGAVTDICSGDAQKSHLVSLVNVSPSSRVAMEDNEWYLFNDFLVRSIPKHEALLFEATWKLPSVVTYQVKSARHFVDDTWKQNLDMSLLYQSWAPRSEHENPTIRPLQYPNEKPQKGTPVGIDSEFVSLQKEELEIKTDGSRAILRPARSGLARISVLRGKSQRSSLPAMAVSTEHPQHLLDVDTSFLPFIDDYIHISDPIVDYLTEFSGIAPGDLDQRTSPYMASGRLVSLKTAYKKIWLLLNLGCVFVGHGLAKDFRTINIHIPRSQVVDTVDLFFIKARQRKLSLRFLSWYLLGEVVQMQAEEGVEGKGHDSVEDARMALKLWEVWKTLDANGKTDEVLEEIYNRGRELAFKVPSHALPEGSRI